VSKMQALLEMQMTIMSRQAEVEFHAAMEQVQSEIMPVVRDAENQHTRSKYARLETIDEAIRPIYTRHGFSLSFDSPPADREGELKIRCNVMHRAGHSKPYELQAPLDAAGSQGKANKTGVQAVGSTTAYLRRYLTVMIFNIPIRNEDRDGNPPVAQGYLSPVQASNIHNLLAACEYDKVSIEKFLAYMGSESVERILASEYIRAEVILKKKLSEKQNGVKR